MKLTRKTEFSAKERKAIHERDKDRCFFCEREYHMEYAPLWGRGPVEIMHIVPRSALGMGVKENGVCGCRYHHEMMDNGNQGRRKEMIRMLEDHMRFLYPGWTRESVTYRKWRKPADGKHPAAAGGKGKT